MSAQPCEPLRVVPPPTQNQVQTAWLLRAREAARRVFDATLAVPRKAAGFIGRVLHKLHLNKAATALRRLATKLIRPVAGTASRLGTSGRVAAAAGVVTSPTGRAVLTREATRLVMSPARHGRRGELVLDPHAPMPACESALEPSQCAQSRGGPKGGIILDRPACRPWPASKCILAGCTPSTTRP